MEEFMEKMESLVEAYREGKHKGKIEDFDYSAIEQNLPCGDQVEIFIKVQDRVFKEIKFQGSGCLLSQVGASLIAENLIGKKLKDIENIDEETIKQLFNIEISPRRMRCATLGLRTIRKALEKRYLINKIPSEEGNIIAIIDKKIKGKVFKEGNKVLDLTSSFYDGIEGDFKDVMESLKDIYTANIVGNDVINLLAKRKKIHKENIKTIGGQKYIHLYTID